MMAAKQMTVTHKCNPATFNCSKCQDPWPCNSGKAELAEEFKGQSTALVNYMATHAIEAASQLLEGDIYDRFITWTRVALRGIPNGDAT